MYRKRHEPAHSNQSPGPCTPLPPRNMGYNHTDQGSVCPESSNMMCERVQVSSCCPRVNYKSPSLYVGDLRISSAPSARIPRLR